MELLRSVGLIARRPLSLDNKTNDLNACRIAPTKKGTPTRALRQLSNLSANLGPVARAACLHAEMLGDARDQISIQAIW